MKEKNIKIADINWLVLKRTPKHEWRYPVICIQIVPVKLTDKENCFIDLKSGNILDKEYFDKIAKEPVGFSGGFAMQQFSSKELLLDICKNGTISQAYHAIYGSKLKCLGNTKKQINIDELKELTKNVNLIYDKIFKPLYNFSGSNRKPQYIERKVL